MPYDVYVSCHFCPWADSINSYALLREIADAAEEMINAHSLKAHGFANHDDAMEEHEAQAEAMWAARADAEEDAKAEADRNRRTR